MKELSILLMGMSLIFMFVIAVVLVLYILAYWMIFRKAGEAGWKALIPFYGTYIEYKLFWNNRMFVLWLIMALIAASLRFVSGPGAMVAQLAYFGVSVMHILISVKMSYSFGHGVGYALGLIFLTPIFLLILAFDESVYIGPGGKKETDREMSVSYTHQMCIRDSHRGGSQYICGWFRCLWPGPFCQNQRIHGYFKGI